jgi:hypothetical protein
LWLYCAAQHLPEGVFGNNWLELHHEASGGAPRVLCVRLNQRAYPRLAWAQTARVWRRGAHTAVRLRFDAGGALLRWVLGSVEHGSGGLKVSE